MTLSPDSLTFCLLSFEGPDRYSQAGGLGVRITLLAEMLATLGFETHLLFVGDPNLPGRELHLNDRLILRRWGQWISAYHPIGVYEAEEAIILFKVGRFDLAKRWLIAVEAAAQLKAEGHRIVFPMIGGIEPHGAEVLARAHELGPSITHVTEQPESWAGLLQTLRKTPSADVYNLRFYVSQEILRPFYASADGVLANSGHEPFGLLGLEAMAAGGLVFTGTTGEEYTLGGQCAIALDTDSPEEIVSHLLTIKADPGQDEAMRESARNRAADFTWEQVTKILLDKVQFVAQASGALPRPNGRDRLVARAPVTIPGQSHPEFFVPPSEDRNFQPTPDIG